MKITNKTEATLINKPYSDIFVVNSARVSFSKESDFDENGNLSIGDQGLLNYLAREEHWTPFSHVRETFILNDIDVEWLLTTLDPTNLAGMVINKVMYNNNSYWAIRHSLFGWIRLLKLNLDEYIFQPTQSKYIYQTLKTLYAGSVVAFAKSFDFSSYETGDNATDAEVKLVNNILEKDNNGDYVYKLFNTKTVTNFVDLTIREIVPVFVSRQRIKHMVGFSINESSRRYVDFEPEYFVPDVLRGRAENKKQGSTDTECFEHDIALATYMDTIKLANENYLALVDKDGTYKTCPEQARAILPQAMMTDYYATGSYAAWKRLEYLRLDSHSQLEIQHHAQKINMITSQFDSDVNDYIANCSITINFGTE